MIHPAPASSTNAANLQAPIHMRPLLLLSSIPCIAGGVLAASSAALAAPASTPPSEPPAAVPVVTAAQLNEDGLEQYAAGEYRRALESFIQAHAIDGDPNVLFNIGRCYEALGELEAAFEKYELFVEAPEADPEGVLRARESMQAIEQARAGRAAPAEARAAGPVALAAVEPAADGGFAQWLPWIALGGTLAFTAAGATFYALGASDHDRVTDMPEYGNPDEVANLTWKQADALVRSGNSKKLVGGISLGVAGALAATYVVLLTSDWGERAPEPQALDVQASTDGAAVTVRGSF